jgi:aspartyl-tRNA(Asn)/glutamyl-tRNA(Gln) amidotransferase subunit C
MGLTEKDVRHVADLAHLELSDVEVRKFQPQLDDILEYVQKLNELDTSDIKPMAQVLGPVSQSPALRTDQIGECLPRELALANAPEQGAGFFKTPSVLERD